MLSMPTLPSFLRLHSLSTALMHELHSEQPHSRPGPATLDQCWQSLWWPEAEGLVRHCLHLWSPSAVSWYDIVAECLFSHTTPFMLHVQYHADSLPVCIYDPSQVFVLVRQSVELQCGICHAAHSRRRAYGRPGHKCQMSSVEPHQGSQRNEGSAAYNAGV